MNKSIDPGQVLLRDFMEPRQLSQNALARAIEVPPRRINEIILGKRKITADTDLRLCRYFKLEPGFWLTMQMTSDLEAREKILRTALEGLPAAEIASAAPGFYTRLAKRRGDDQKLRECVESVVSKLEASKPDSERPGMLLGRIQSGKTRAFIGVIARAFDRDFDIAVILTKSTKTLAAQTVARLSADFGEPIGNGEILVFDIMKPPGRLIKGDMKKKMIIVAKKQVDNLERLNTLFTEDYPNLGGAKVLLVDDEADLASIRFVSKNGAIEQGKIAQKMVEFRKGVKDVYFLQVTATPYSLYLQPEGYRDQNSNPIFKPMKPAFTVVLPQHAGYVGGDVYFGTKEEGDVASHLFVPVEAIEQHALRAADKRRIKPSNVLITPNCKGLTQGVVTFVLAACIRQWQQRNVNEKPVKNFAMIIHNDMQRASHTWQELVVQWIVEAITANVEDPSDDLVTVFNKAYADLEASIQASGGDLPDNESAFEMFLEAFEGGEVATEKVNSDKDVMALLDDNAELRLRLAFNIFIGGSILDRGITVPNLIAFYYGRNPQTTQADTVLQHSRMYGNRSPADVAVTRLYTSQAVYDRMYTINTFETALREAFAKGEDGDGVVFISADKAGRVRPCDPNKLLLSDLVAVRSGGLYLPTGFELTTKAAASAADRELRNLVPAFPKSGGFTEINSATAKAILAVLSKPIDVTKTDFDWEAMEGLLTYYTDVNNGKVRLYVETGRQLDKIFSGEKSGASIVGTRLRSELRNPGRKVPALVLLQQEGKLDQNWSGYPFWWPILAAPEGSQPCVFAKKVAS